MKELRDQSAHFVAAIVALLPAVFFPGPLSFAWAGFSLGVVREMTEKGVITLPAARRALGSRLDLTFWTLGGLIAGLGAL